MVVGLAGVAGVLAVLRPGSGPSTSSPPWSRRPPPPPRCGGSHRIDDQGATATVSRDRRRTEPARGPGRDRRPRRGRRGHGGAGRWVTSYRLGGTDIALPVATDPAPSFPAGPRGDVRRHQPVAHAERRLLPRRHPPDRADRRRRLVDPDHRRRRRRGGHADLRRPRRDADSSSATSPSPASPTRSAAPTSAAPAGSAYRWPTCSPRPASTRPRPTRSSRTDVDGMTISTPLDVATRRPRRDDRDRHERRAARPATHGFPARMVVPGLYGFVSACKWITRMTLTTYDAEQAYWTERDWAIDAPIKISSRIDTPKPLSSSKAGKVIVGGIAWAQHVRHRQGRGPHRRRGLEARDARPAGQRRLLAPVVLRVGRRARASTSSRAARPTRTATCRPTSRMTPFPEGSMRPAGDLRHRRADAAHPAARRAVCGAGSEPPEPAPLTARAAFRSPITSRTFSTRHPSGLARRSEHLLTAGHHGPSERLPTKGNRHEHQAPHPHPGPRRPRADRVHEPGCLWQRERHRLRGRAHHAPRRHVRGPDRVRALEPSRAADGPFGPGCAAVPTDGDGSFDGMANDPVATAAVATTRCSRRWSPPSPRPVSSTR